MTPENLPAVYARSPGLWKKAKSALCCAIVLLTLALIGLLAIPACLLTGLMGAVWNLGDKLLTRLSG